MNSIGIGIHGTGLSADYHGYALAKNKYFSLKAVSDDGYPQALSYAKRHHVDKCYGDLEYLLSCPDVDIVVVASPFFDNVKILPYIIETGRSVIMETPLAGSLEDAERIVGMAEDIFLFPVSQMASDPLMKYTSSLIKEGKLGEIRDFSLLWSFPSPVKRWMNQWGREKHFDEKLLFLQSASGAFNLVYTLFGVDEVLKVEEGIDGVRIVFNNGSLVINDGNKGFSFSIKGENGGIEGENGRLKRGVIEGREISGFDKESIRNPYSPLSFWYDDVYSALESGVWPREKYTASLIELKLIYGCLDKMFIK